MLKLLFLLLVCSVQTMRIYSPSFLVEFKKQPHNKKMKRIVFSTSAISLTGIGIWRFNRYKAKKVKEKYKKEEESKREWRRILQREYDMLLL